MTTTMVNRRAWPAPTTVRCWGKGFKQLSCHFSGFIYHRHTLVLFQNENKPPHFKTETNLTSFDTNLFPSFCFASGEFLRNAETSPPTVGVCSTVFFLTKSGFAEKWVLLELI